MGSTSSKPPSLPLSFGSRLLVEMAAFRPLPLFLLHELTPPIPPSLLRHSLLSFGPRQALTESQSRAKTNGGSHGGRGELPPSLHPCGGPAPWRASAQEEVQRALHPLRRYRPLHPCPIETQIQGEEGGGRESGSCLAADHRPRRWRLSGR